MKPSNYVAKHAYKSNKPQVHKDKKKLANSGYAKHKSKYHV